MTKCPICNQNTGERRLCKDKLHNRLELMGYWAKVGKSKQAQFFLPVKALNILIEHNYDPRPFIHPDEGIQLLNFPDNFVGSK